MGGTEEVVVAVAAEEMIAHVAEHDVAEDRLVTSDLIKSVLVVAVDADVVLIGYCLLAAVVDGVETVPTAAADVAALQKGMRQLSSAAAVAVVQKMKDAMPMVASSSPAAPLWTDDDDDDAAFDYYLQWYDCPHPQ